MHKKLMFLLCVLNIENGTEISYNNMDNSIAGSCVLPQKIPMEVNNEKV